jgi:hypothetical protein
MRLTAPSRFFDVFHVKKALGQGFDRTGVTHIDWS